MTRGAVVLVALTCAPALASAREATELESEPSARTASAPLAPPIEPRAPESPKTEYAAFPIVAGNSDIGVQLGVAGFITRVAAGARPYVWKSDVLLSASFKPSPGEDAGIDVAHQAYDLRLDLPRYLGTRVRVMPGVFVERHVNSGYFGLGNDAPAIPLRDGTFGRRYQAITEEVRVRLNVRFPLHGPIDGMAGIMLRYTDATAYAGSKLEADSRVVESNGEPRVRGLDPIASAIPAVGVVYDTRDNEISPRSGSFHIVGLRAMGGLPSSRDVGYVGGSVVLRKYVPLPGSFVFATRFVGDVMAGNAPFYDLAQGVTFTPVDLIGGHGGLRGVPNGRYTGKVKVLASAELRTLLVTFGLLGQRLRLGAQAFVDVGRIWSELPPDSRRDGRGVGLKYGVGGGFYLIWGEAAVVRLELAYSPDAHDANPGLPIGIYAADGHAF